LRAILEFLSRPGCHLCDDARPLVHRAARFVRADVSEIDIDPIDDLVADFGIRIPVVRWRDGDVIAEGVIEFAPLVKAAFRSRPGRGQT